MKKEALTDDWQAAKEGDHKDGTIRLTLTMDLEWIFPPLWVSVSFSVKGWRKNNSPGKSSDLHLNPNSFICQRNDFGSDLTWPSVFSHVKGDYPRPVQGVMKLNRGLAPFWSKVGSYANLASWWFLELLHLRDSVILYY